MTMAKRVLIIIALLETCLSGALWAGTAPTGFLYESNLFPGQHSGFTSFAQNDQKKPSDDVSTDDSSKIQKDANKPGTLTQEKDVPKKTKPMKPFVPSETIPVDQGVDFPYDI